MAFCVSMDPHLCSICLFIRLSFDFPMCTPDSSAAQKIMYPISSISFFGCISVQGQNLADPASKILVRQLERGRCKAKLEEKLFIRFFHIGGSQFFSACVALQNIRVPPSRQSPALLLKKFQNPRATCKKDSPLYCE